MNIVDSSCWLEYFAGTEIGDNVAAVLQKTEDLLVPSITIYEVFKKLLNDLNEDSALLATAHMKQGTVIDLNSDLAVYSAQLSRDFKLPMAASIIYAVTKKFNAKLWTQDRRFKSLESVEYYEKKR